MLDDETKGKDYIVVMGDFNAVVGECTEVGYVGHYGLGYCNDRYYWHWYYPFRILCKLLCIFS